MRREGVRVAISTLTALLGALGAHHLGGGGFVSASALAIESSLLLAVLVLMRRHKYEGPGLAAVIAVSQLFSHFILGTSTSAEGTNSTRMLIAHATFGIFTYFLIAKFEDFWLGFVCFVSEILLPTTFLKYTFESLQKVRVFSIWLRSVFLFFIQAHGLRAPPSILLSI
jgi:hypothetical protein